MWVSVRLGLEDDDARDLLLDGWSTGDTGSRRGRLPANDGGVAVVPRVQDLESDRGLAALAGDECLARGERWSTELCSVNTILSIARM